MGKRMETGETGRPKTVFRLPSSSVLFSLLFSRRGDSFAWTAALLVFVGVPLMSLSIDVMRLMYVRGHLHTATDAACQAAADALDVNHFTSTGEAKINPGLARSQAAQVFNATLVDSTRVLYGMSLEIDFPGPRLAHCVATAPVDHIIPMTPKMVAVVETTSEMRTRANEGDDGN